MSKIVPRPKAWPIIGTLGALIASGGAEKLHKYVDDRHRELGTLLLKLSPGFFFLNT